MTGVLNKYQCRFMIVSRLIILIMKNVSEEVAETYKTHILCSITLFFFENRVVYEIMQKMMVESDGPQITI
jgi:hypothetical protein